MKTLNFATLLALTAVSGGVVITQPAQALQPNPIGGSVGRAMPQAVPTFRPTPIQLPKANTAAARVIAVPAALHRHATIEPMQRAVRPTPGTVATRSKSETTPVTAKTRTVVAVHPKATPEPVERPATPAGAGKKTDPVAAPGTGKIPPIGNVMPAPPPSLNQRRIDSAMRQAVGDAREALAAYGGQSPLIATFQYPKQSPPAANQIWQLPPLEIPAVGSIPAGSVPAWGGLYTDPKGNTWLLWKVGDNPPGAIGVWPAPMRVTQAMVGQVQADLGKFMAALNKKLPDALRNGIPDHGGGGGGDGGGSPGSPGGAGGINPPGTDNGGGGDKWVSCTMRDGCTPVH